MSMADERIHRHRGVHHLGKAAHLAEIGYSHLNDRSLVLRLNSKDGERDAELVIKVFLCLEYIVLLRKHRCDHFLCSCLADASGDADNGNVKALAVVLGKCLECRRNIGYNDDRANDIIRHMFGYAADSAKLKCFVNVVVAIDTLAL